MKLLPKGLWPVMLTPFTDRNELDVPALKELTEFYIAAGAKGLFANCLSSEMFQLTDDERLLVTRTVVKASNGRVPVVATGLFGNDIDVSLRFIHSMHDTGVEAVVINTNQLCDEYESDDAFKFQVETLLESTGAIPLGLYECPVPYKRLISPTLLKWMACTNRFLFHKDTSCNLSDIQSKLMAIKGTPLGFYNAHIPTGIDSIINGARGLAPISANLYPELLSCLFNALEYEGKTERVETLSQSLIEMDSIIHNNYPSVAKSFLIMRGLRLKSHCRVATSTMQKEHIKGLEHIMNSFEQLSSAWDIDIVRFE